MPDALELPRTGCPVIPLVGARDAGKLELVTDGLPRLAAIVRALNQLTEPTVRL